MIFKGSRYEAVARRTFTVTSTDGLSHAALPIRFLSPTPGWYRHVVTANDRLDLLAAAYYGRPDRFWLIADANRALDPLELLKIGAEIVVPPDRPS